MQTFDPGKSRKTKLTNVITEAYRKCSIPEQSVFFKRLLQGFSLAQTEILFNICRNILRPYDKPVQDKQSDTAPLQKNELTEDDMVMQLINDILFNLPMYNEGEEKKKAIKFGVSKTLPELAKSYFLNKAKIQDMGRNKMYPTSSVFAQRPSSSKSTQSTRSGRSSASSIRMSRQLTESLSIVADEWKLIDQFELCIHLLKSSDPKTIIHFRDLISAQLRKTLNVEQLPDHIMLYIFSYLPLSDLSSCSRTCRKWSGLIRSQRLWHFKSIEIGRTYLNCPDLSTIVLLAVKSKFSNRSQDALQETNIDWKSVCKLAMRTVKSAKPAPTPKFKDIEHPVPTRIDLRRRLKAGAKVDLSEKDPSSSEDESDSHRYKTNLPPIKLFPKRIAPPIINEFDEEEGINSLMKLKDDDFSKKPDTGMTVDPNIKSDNSKSNEESSKTKYYSQVSSIVKTQVPVYPDVEKPLKAMLQDVLDMKILQGHMGVILSLYFDGVRLYSGGSDSVIRLWNPRGTKCHLKLLGHKGGIHALDYCLTSHTLYSGSWDTTIRKWDVGNSRAAGVMSGHRGGVSTVCVLSVWHLLSSANDGTVRLWNTHGCECLIECELIPSPECEVNPLIRMEVHGYREHREFNPVNRDFNVVLSTILCSDGSVFIHWLKRHPPVIPNLNKKTNEPGGYEHVRWLPWSGVTSDRHILHRGLAISLHGDMLAVATYGNRITPTSGLGRPGLTRKQAAVVYEDNAPKGPTEGGVIWLAKISPKTKSLIPHLFAAIKTEFTPSALCAKFGKLYVGFVHGYIQIWDLGDMVKVQEFQAHTSRIRDIQSSSDLVTSCDDDGKIVVSKMTPLMQQSQKTALVGKR